MNTGVGIATAIVALALIATGSDEHRPASWKGPDMNPSAAKRAREVSALAQQQADFTAEGSPPPREVATSVPIATNKTAKATSRAPLRGHR